MVTKDMVAMMDFLRVENNGYTNDDKTPNLNLCKLCIVGADLGAVVALNFARMDWDPRNASPIAKYPTNQFTKAIVLLSPVASCRGLIRPATSLGCRSGNMAQDFLLAAVRDRELQSQDRVPQRKDPPEKDASNAGRQERGADPFF